MFLHHEAEGIVKWLDSWKFDAVAVVPFLMLFLAALAEGLDPDVIPATFAGMVALSPIWLPVMLFIMFWRRWMHYIRFNFWFTQEMVLLHIELPPNIEKSPLAMELVLTALWNAGGETTFIARIWEGKFRAITSLEIASNGGRIGYYVHLRRAWKNVFESRLYGQFPEARVTEVEDYVQQARYSPDTHILWGTEYAKDSKSEDAVPIRTYVNWGLDENTDEPEQQIDPMTNLLEFMSSIGPDECVWFQIIIKARKKDEWYGFYLSKDKYKEGGKKAIEAIFDEAVGRLKNRVDEESAKNIASRGAQLLSQPEKDRIEAIERNFSKLIFECGFRTVYLAKKDKFNGVNNGNLVRFFDPFKFPDYNSLGVVRGLSNFDYPWQDFREWRHTLVRRQMYFWYKHRAYFYVPLEQDPVMMTTEELATIWHFPSAGVKTPGLVRVPSRVSEAPPNLPTAPANLPGQ